MEKRNCLQDRFFRKHTLSVIAGIVFLCLLPLNLLTPMISDDFAYCLSFADKQPIQNIQDIFHSQYAHYHTMNGRVLLHFLVQLSMLLPGVLFKFVNSGMYVALGLLIYQHIYADRQERSHPILLILIYTAMWHWLPLFGDTVLWQDGAINYLWGAVIMLLFLLPYRLHDSRENVFMNKSWNFFMFLMGMLAGACNENTSGAACLAAGLYLVRFFLCKRKFRGWTVSGLAGAITGFLLMILAPGNFKRAAGLSGGSSDSFMHLDSLRHAFMKFIWLSHKIASVGGVWLVYLTIFLAAYLFFKTKSFRKLGSAVIYLVCMPACVYAMMIPPIVPERSLFGAVVFWITGLGIMVSQLEVKKDMAVTLALLTCILSLTGVQYLEGLKQNVLVFAKYQQRISYVQQQKAEGNLDLVFDYIEPHGAYCAWGDMTADPNNYYNSGFAKYYGISSAVVRGGPEIQE